VREVPGMSAADGRADRAARLREAALAYLAARPGEWVPRRELHALTPLVTVHVTEADGETAFGHDDARGSAWDEVRPDDDLVIEVMRGLRLELRAVERVSPDRSWPEYLLLPDAELVGLGEIQARMGVERDTVDHWRHRGVMPEPDPADNEGRRPRWRWGAIRAWAVETGRGAAVRSARR
jgi:hypothetical protein